jgi:hypothetical protein
MEVLEPIFSHKHAVQSLTLNLSSTKTGLDDSDFSRLNVDSINELRFILASIRMSIEIMDLAVDSSSQNFSLTVYRPKGSIVPLLEHDLMQRVFELSILAGEDIF